MRAKFEKIYHDQIFLFKLGMIITGMSYTRQKFNMFKSNIFIELVQFDLQHF